MAKRSPKKVKIPAENISEPHGSLKLDDLTREKLLRLEAEIKYERGQADISSMTLNNYLQQVDPKGEVRRLEGMIQAHVAQAEIKSIAYKDAIKQVEAKLGIEMKNYSFDDESGILHELQTGG